MITILASVFSFLASGVPKILDYFQDKKDKEHELLLLAAQTERELKLAERGYLAQQKVEEIKYQGLELTTATDERKALYQHDIEIGKGASQWVIDCRAIVRPVITFGLLVLLMMIEAFGFYYAIQSGVSFLDAMKQLWDHDMKIIWASVISFWFGSQAFARK